MGVTYGFYNSVGGDRRYNASQISELFNGLINDGVFMSIGNSLVVSAMSGMDVSVGTGRAWFNGTWTDNDAQLPLMVSPSEVVLNRIDTVVLEVNSNIESRQNEIKIVKGVPGSSPSQPVLIKTEMVNQYPLCNIYVAAGVTAITQANITNRVGTSDCPFVTGILETMNIDVLLTQWEAQFNTWFNTLENILDENTAGNLLNLINNKIIKGASTIPTTGWVANVGGNTLKLDLAITDVVIGDWVELTVDKDYQDVAQDAEINATVDEYNGGVTIYANTAPSVAIPIRYKVVK